MPSNRALNNSILMRRRRPYNLSKCNLEGCHNFITSLNYVPKRICSSHLDKDHHKLSQFKELKTQRDYTEIHLNIKSVIQHQKGLKHKELKRI